MKNSSIISALIGGAFFAIPYLGLSAGILPSLAIGVCAYGAGELLLNEKKKADLKNNNKTLYDNILEAKEMNKDIVSISSKVEDDNLKKNIREINKTVSKIISTIENNPKKSYNMNNFFSYYLPVTLNILKKYDEIENQELTTEDGKKFLKQTENMIEKINEAFKNQLSNMYQADMVDTDAEMRVFDSMLKADGYDSSNDFVKKEEGAKNESK